MRNSTDLINQKEDLSEKKQNEVQIVWFNVFYISMLHFGALIGIERCFTSAKWQTVAACFVLWSISKVGTMAGSHRLWSHRSYKANIPLRVILIMIQAMAYENSAYEWARDHRVHHKYSETDADPHNSKRGFFFAHMGWNMCKKHPEVIAKGKTIDLNDLHEDKICMFQHRHYKWFMTGFAFVLPALIPWYFWDESVTNSVLICSILRCVIGHHTTWSINSVAHFWGRRPYDKHMHPAENRAVSLLTCGEGFHNYHHTFPWDYAASELGYGLNMTKLFIDFFALLGWATDRKVVSPEMIKARKLRTGDVLDHGPYGKYN